MCRLETLAYQYLTIFTARHDRGAPAVPLAKELAERDSFASRDSCVFLALSA
jgi:hypothetical protein